VSVVTRSRHQLFENDPDKTSTFVESVILNLRQIHASTTTHIRTSKHTLLLSKAALETRSFAISTEEMDTEVQRKGPSSQRDTTRGNHDENDDARRMLIDDVVDENDSAEDQLQSWLSCLSEQGNAFTTDVSNNMNEDKEDWSSTQPPETASWIWARLTGNDENKRFSCDSMSTTNMITPPNAVWEAALQHIHDLLLHITPFELHAVASQAILFAEGQEETEHGKATTCDDFVILCLLLCANSLRRCPCPLTSRFKRWQSILCETIRLFQQQESSKPMTNLWISFLCPGCIHVVWQLAVSQNDAVYHAGLFAGLIGTTSRVVEQAILPHCDSESELGQHLVAPDGTLRSVSEAFTAYQDYTSDSMTIWKHPWRVYYWNLSQSAAASRIPETADDDDNDLDMELWIHRNDLSWWIHQAHQEDRVANMDTTWSTTGLTAMAMNAFQTRPMVYHPSFIWKMWFPWVTQLFKESNQLPKLLDRLSMDILQSLLLIVPDQSLSLASILANDESFHKRPDAPMEVIQMMSDRMMAPPAKYHGETERRRHAEHIVGLIRALLDRYVPRCQVQMVKKLVHDCPNPGLQARFLDLLRSLLFEDDCQEPLTSLLNHQVDQLCQQHIDQNSKQLVNVEDLIENVEVYASTIGLIQKWSMGRGDNRGPSTGDLKLRDKFWEVHTALQQLFDRWSSDHHNINPPDNHFRLFLLDSALSLTLSN
jgi:hypothetical protein